MSLRIRRWLLAAAIAGAGAIAPAGQGFAWMDWCESDPPVTVVTAGGHHVTVNNYLGTTWANRHLLDHATVSGYAKSAGPGQSVIHVLVVLPSGGSAYVHARSTSGHYSQTVESDGAWGQVIELEMTVPVS